MHGPLSEIGLVEVLQLLERGRRTGELRIVGPDPTAPRTLVVHEGRITALAPDASDAALDGALVLRHLAAPGDGEDAVPLVTREVLRGRLAARAIAAMLHWGRGRFDFEAGPVAAGPLALSIDTVVLDVVAAESRRVDLAAALRDFHAVPDFVVDDSGAGPVPPLLPLDWRILDAVDGVRSVAAIAGAVGEALEDVAERVQVLEAATILVLRAAAADVALDARAAIEAGRYEEAAGLLRDRVTSVPADGESWRALGLAEVGAGRFDRAIEAWRAWGAADPRRSADAESLVHAARTMLEALLDTRD
ncbi:MAG TPA: DUF4388 domain-containing protein [Gemmatimonadales bacterium]|jgi:tetratricopeptide (TPR) repeat protein|nr:DUF4388 domain-containing protein [Gemmatimonadales bacterium]